MSDRPGNGGIVGRNARGVAVAIVTGTLVVGWIDWHALRLPDELTPPLIAVGLLAAWLGPPLALAIWLIWIYGLLID
jgi:prepilin signal peptidase PulO-like enzyme (type II secretory pathway)